MKAIKRNSLYLLAITFVLCLVMAFVPFAPKNVRAEAPDIASGFTVKGAYIQMELGTEENPDSGKFSLTFVADITEAAYTTAAAQGELKVGLLVGRKSFLSNLTSNPDMTAALTEYGFKALSNVGSAGSGSQQEIVFIDGVAEIQAGIVFDESKLPEGKLQAAAKMDLVAVPYVTYVGDLEDSADDVSYIYTANAVDRAARPIVHECYVRSNSFDYEKYAEVDNKPVVVTKEMVKKFVVDVDDPNMYVEIEGEYYYDVRYKTIQAADPTTNQLAHKQVLVAADLPFGWAWNTHKAYIGGVYYPGGTNQVFNTGVVSGGLGNLNLEHLAPSDKMSYGFTIFRNTDGAVVNYTVKRAEMIIKSMNAGGTNTYESITGPFNGAVSFNGLFTNRVVSNTAGSQDRNITETYEGLWVLGNDIKMLATPGRGINANGIVVGGTGNYAGINPIYNNGDNGFKGTFDGRGFGFYDGLRNGTNTYNSASGATEYATFFQGCGMFTWINGGTVKNVSFYNITLTAVPRNGSILAYAITGNSTIENVYINPLVNSWNTTYPYTGISWEQGQLLATHIEDSTLRNIIVESDFFDDKDGELVEGINHFELLNESDNNNVYENVFSIGNTPVSYDANKSTKELIMTVNALPVIDDVDTVATAGEAYLLADYPVLKEAYGAYAYDIVDDCRGAFNDAMYPAISVDEISITFNLNKEGVMQFSGYRDLAAYVNDAENEAVKTALVNSGFFSVAESGFVTPKNIPHSKTASNNRLAGYTYGNRVDDCIILSFTASANASTPIHDGVYNGPTMMVMAAEDGKFYADLTPLTSDLAGRVLKYFIYNDSNAHAGSGEVFITAEQVATATAWEIPTGVDTLFKRV